MWRRSLSLLATLLLTVSLAGPAFAEEVKGTITKVGDEGRDITVKTKDGKEVQVKISGSRTTIEGVKGRSDLKAGQMVTVDHDKGEAKKVMVSGGKEGGTKESK
jgi:predicted metal-dependent RNase